MRFWYNAYVSSEGSDEPAQMCPLARAIVWTLESVPHYSRTLMACTGFGK